MEDKPRADRRVIRTKRLISKAFTELLQQKAFSSITVEEITEKADLGRTTFYLHFHDLEELLDHVQTELFYGFLDAGFSKNMDYLLEPYFINEHQQALTGALEYAKNNARTFHAVFSVKGDAVFDQLLFTNFEQRYPHVVYQNGSYLPSLSYRHEYPIVYFLSANLSVVKRWLMKGCPEEPRELAIYLLQLTEPFRRCFWNEPSANS